MYIIGEEEVQAVRRVIESGQLFRYRGGEGGETDRFEREWAERIGVKHALAVTSGTAALICGLAGLEIGPGDEVIVPAFTFMATALAPLAVGAMPVIAEIDESLTIDPDDVGRKVTPRSKAIIPVHMCGLASNMDAIMRIAHKHDLKVLEDACQSAGGSYKGRLLGSIGNAGAFSFNHFKIITCGEGGALVTNDRIVHERALIHHDGGCVFRDHASQISVPFFAGWNFRMNEILSAILTTQAQRLDGILDALRAEKRRMMTDLADQDAFSLNPIHDPEGDCGTTLAILFDSPERAKAFIEELGKEGVRAGTPIDSGRHVYTNWEPVLERRGAHHPRRDAFRMSESSIEYSPDMCPGTLSILARTVCIPMSPTRPPDESGKLAACIKKTAARC